MRMITTSTNRSATQPKLRRNLLRGSARPTPSQESLVSTGSDNCELMTPWEFISPRSILLMWLPQYGHGSTLPATASLVSINSWQCGQWTKKVYSHSGQIIDVSGTCCLQ